VSADERRKRRRFIDDSLKVPEVSEVPDVSASRRPPVESLL